MDVGRLNHLNRSSLLAAGAEVAAKLAIPKSKRMINADSLKWVDKFSTSIRNRITSSIQDGKLFELASLGANIFGIPAFFERGLTLRPVLNFEQGHDQDLNLASVDMQDDAGKTHRWASSPTAAAPSSAPSTPTQGQAAPPLPPLPRKGPALTSIGVALNSLHQTTSTVRNAATPPHLPPRNAAGKSGTLRGGRDATASVPQHRPPQLPLTPQEAEFAVSHEADNGSPPEKSGMQLDDIERFLIGPSFAFSPSASLKRQNALRRPSRPAIQNELTSGSRREQRSATFPPERPPKTPLSSSETSTGGVTMNVPDSLRPGLGRRLQSNQWSSALGTLPPDTLRPGLPPKAPLSASERSISPDPMAFPDSLRPGPTALRSSEPTNAIEARSRLAAAVALSAVERPTTVLSATTAPVRFSDLQPMQQVYQGEETGKVFGTSVKYLNDRERAGFKMVIKDGKAYDAAGQLFDTRQASTSFAQNKGRAIFVMDATGALYISNEQTKGKFHHSSFFAGRPVAAAGDIRIENGLVTAISRKSGHYRPTATQLNQAIRQLNTQGVSGIFVDEDLN